MKDKLCVRKVAASSSMKGTLADVLQGREQYRKRLMFKVSDLMCDLFKGSVILLPTCIYSMQKTAFITVVTVASFLAQAGMCSVLKHFSSHVKLLRELKFCRSITSGPYVPVVQVDHVKKVLDKSATD